MRPSCHKLSYYNVHEKNQEKRKWVYKQEDEVKKEKTIREQIQLLSPYHIHTCAQKSITAQKLISFAWLDCERGERTTA
jgi:hypothetical protein